MPLYEPPDGPNLANASVTDALIDLISEAVLRALRKHSQDAARYSPDNAIGPTEPALMTARELEKLLALPERRIYELAKRGDLPAIKIGRLVRFRKEAVAAWVASRERGSSGQTTESGK